MSAGGASYRPFCPSCGAPMGRPDLTEQALLAGILSIEDARKWRCLRCGAMARPAGLGARKREDAGKPHFTEPR